MSASSDLTIAERVRDLEERQEKLEARQRGGLSRLAQLEDSVSVYGPPKRPLRLPIPELSREQRSTMLVFAFLMGVPIMARVIVSLRETPRGEEGFLS